MTCTAVNGLVAAVTLGVPAGAAGAVTGAGDAAGFAGEALEAGATFAGTADFPAGAATALSTATPSTASTLNPASRSVRRVLA